MEIKKVLVTGSEGYIGSVMVPLLIKEGFEVQGLDNCYFSEGNLVNTVVNSYPLLIKDVRDVEEKDLRGFDAVVHLAALSNDPLGKLNEELTYDINYKATINLAKKARNAGVKRFLFSSSCSLYGASSKVLSEEDCANPQTAYGKSKILAESDLLRLADDYFSPVFLRNATAFGISPRMRFDLVVNSLSGFAKTQGTIMILGDGTPWRPLVHIKDISFAFIACLKSKRELIHAQAFNVGDDKENYQIKTIAEEIKKYFSDCQIEIKQKNANDTRNYMVTFEKIKNKLGYRISYSLSSGVKEIVETYDRINLNKEVFEHRNYTRLLQIEYLIERGLIDNQLKWINRRG